MTDQTISHYHIKRQLGAGGMGTVYLAYDPSLERDVAIKVLSEDLSLDESYRQRFLTEARSASALNHPNIVTVYEIGNHEGRDFIAMEYIEGETLKNLINRREPLPAAEILDLGIQLASALAAAHHAGIIHRDLKPDNVVVTPDGRSKILDFGLAKRRAGPQGAVQDPDSVEFAVTQAMSLTQPGMILGTPGYMAPEKARGEEGDHRADIFSLGCILYALTTSKAPFTGNTVVDVLHNVIHQEPDSLDAARPDLPASLCAVVNRCLAKQPRDRYADAGDLEAALQEIQAELTHGSLGPASGLAAAPRPARRNPLLIGLVSLGLVLAAVAIYIFRPGVGVATTTVTVQDEDGQQISREIPTREYRKRLAVFPFAPDFSDTNRLWLTYAVAELLVQDLLQDYYISLDLAAVDQFAREATKTGYPGGLGAPLSLKRKVAKESNCSHFVTGRIGAAGDSVWTEVQVYVTDSGRLESESRYSGTDVFGLIDAASLQVRRQLGVPDQHLHDWPDLPVVDISTASLVALEASCRASMAVYVDNDLPAMHRYLEAAVEEDPSYAMALWGLYISYLFAGEGANPRIPEVLDALMTHIYRLPERLQFAVKANYFEYNGDPDKQFTVLKMWAELYPDDNLAQETLVLIYSIRGQDEEAFAAQRRLLELEPNNPAYLTQAADLYRKKGDLVTARSHLEKYLEVVPDDPQAFRKLGDLVQLMGDHQEARSYFEKALALEPRDLELQLALAEVEFQLGHFAASREILEATLADPLSPGERLSALEGLVDYYKATGQLGRAVEIAGQALAESQGQVQPFRLIIFQGIVAILHASKGDRDEALALIDDLRERVAFPLTAIASIFVMVAYLELDDLEAASQAAAEIETAIVEMRWEHLRTAWLAGTGAIREVESDLEGALDRYNRWLELEPTDVDVHTSLARCLRKLDRPQEALLSIERSLTQQPFNAEILYEAALIEWDNGREDAALVYLERALEVWQEADPDYGPAGEARETLVAWGESG